MANPKLRRTLYIGLGGTGIKVIKEVKKNFLNNSGRLPSMVKFLCVDTNKGDLDGKNNEGVEKLTSLEKLHLSVSEPQAALNDGASTYDWIPKSNRDSVVDIEDTGAGQVRSNGRFILEDCELKHNSFSERLNQLVNQLTAVTNTDPDYDLLSATNIDIHLVFSIAGGTGSGMFLTVANLIRRHIPKANLMAYAFSPSFFTSVGVNWNITHNAYGALVELDYYMHGGKGKYTNSARGITKKLFDSVMYIDKNTYTRDHSEDTYNYDFDEVKVIVAHALYLSAGEIGTNALSIVDNLRTAMNSGGYDKECSNSGIKGAWVSSIGVSEIFCNPKADVEYKTIESSTNILRNLLNGERVGSAVAETNRWITTLNLDESNGEADGNYLIDRMLKPEKFKTLKSRSKIVVDDKGEFDDSKFIEVNDTDIDPCKEKPETVIDEKRKAIIKKIKDELFPSSGTGTIGVKTLITVVAGLKSDILASKLALQSEINVIVENQGEIDEKIKTQASIVKEEMSRGKMWRDTNAIYAAKDLIRKYREENYKCVLEIERRTAAIKVYDELNKFLAEYVAPDTGYLCKLQSNIEKGIDELDKNSSKIFTYKTTSRESTSIDLTSRADKLSTSAADVNPVKDWQAYFTVLGHMSVENLSSKADWDKSAQSYYKSLQESSVFSPIIVRVMDTFSKEERIAKYKDLINRARPLMDISTYGKSMNPSEFIFVSYPCDVKPQDLNTFLSEFGEALGTDKFELIPQKDSNKILVYRQLGVIPPFYISGISHKKNGIVNPESCEAKYTAYINRAGEQRKVKPFTDVYFERAYENDGHSLDSEYIGQVKSKIDMWVDSFILGLIKREGDVYHLEHEMGEYDPLDEEERNWFYLGIGRKAAYQNFKGQTSDFFDILEKQINQLKEEKDTFYNSFFDGTQTEKDRNKMYKEKYSLVDLYQKDEAIPSTLEMIKLEINSIKARTV